MQKISLEELNTIGFDNMYKMYGRWWLDDGILKFYEVKSSFLDHLYSVTDVIVFCDTYMKWPVIPYYKDLDIPSNDYSTLKEIYDTYQQSKQSYIERKNLIDE